MHPSQFLTLLPPPHYFQVAPTSLLPGKILLGMWVWELVGPMLREEEKAECSLGLE